MKINKSMEIAEFALAQGQFLSAREMFNMGFRYSHGETTPDGISAVMNKLHESSRFTLLRQVRKEKNGEPTRIMVTEIKEREGSNRGAMTCCRTRPTGGAGCYRGEQYDFR